MLRTGSRVHSIARVWILRGRCMDGEEQLCTGPGGMHGTYGSDRPEVSLATVCHMRTALLVRFLTSGGT